jgi:hypothetical protein
MYLVLMYSEREESRSVTEIRGKGKRGGRKPGLDEDENEISLGREDYNCRKGQQDGEEEVDDYERMVTTTTTTTTRMMMRG